MSPDATPRLPDYLDHILDAIARVRRYTAGMDRPEFVRQELVQDAVVRNLEVIGEAAHNILRRYPAFASTNAELPWTSAYEMRNALAHGYYRVDLDVVWRTLIDDLPDLEARIRALRGFTPEG
jgi:uncharacterized protein with HEPN domain